jgi:hypothetical protein
VDTAKAVGVAVIAPGIALKGLKSSVVGLVALLVVASPAAAAGNRYALIVTGASGGPDYAKKYDTWRSSLVSILAGTFEYPAENLIVLAEQARPGVREANRQNVRQALDSLRRRAGADDVVLVVLIGHGTVFDGEPAKFNLVGLDLSVEDWAAGLRPIGGRLVFVNAASASFPFLKAVARRGRVVVTATAAAAQQYETVFAEFFIRALSGGEADADNDGRVSVWETFSHASAAVKTWYDEQQRLPTERALLDDTGLGIGRDAAAEGEDGDLARSTYLEPDRVTGGSGERNLARSWHRLTPVIVNRDRSSTRR